jgi:hypothetical protein
MNNSDDEEGKAERCVVNYSRAPLTSLHEIFLTKYKPGMN